MKDFLIAMKAAYAPPQQRFLCNAAGNAIDPAGCKAVRSYSAWQPFVRMVEEHLERTIKARFSCVTLEHYVARLLVEADMVKNTVEALHDKRMDQTVHILRSTWLDASIALGNLAPFWTDEQVLQAWVSTK